MPTRSTVLPTPLHWLLLLIPLCLGLPAAAAEPIDIGSRLELLVDDALLESVEGLRTQVHRPRADQVVLRCDRPWEGNISAYFTVLFDGQKYRMYYRGAHWDVAAKKVAHPEVTCYAESADGVNWDKPELGLFEFDGSKRNNIVWAGVGTHNFTVCLDPRPQCPPQQRFKALAAGTRSGKRGLFAHQSADGIHWQLMQSEPVITEGAFDSQNLAFWDSHLGKFREYHRSFRGGVRCITTGVSDDFLHWTKPVFLQYGDAPNVHLYTNAVLPHPRAPHLLLGFPTRYYPERQSQVEPLLMASRDGVRFRRFDEPLIPVTAPQDRLGNRSNYMAWGLVDIPGDPHHEAVYATEAYYKGPAGRLRRFIYAKDRYVSLAAGKTPGEVVTKPLLFAGQQLLLNHDTHAGGSLQVEIQDPQGRPIKPYTLANCGELTGDQQAQVVRWQGAESLAELAGRPVRLRLVLRQAEWFAWQFR